VSTNKIWDDVLKSCFIYLLFTVTTGIFVLFLLHSLGVLPQPLLIFSSDFLSLAGITVSLIAISAIGSWIAGRWKIKNKWVILGLVVLVLATEIPIAAFSISFLTPQTCPLLPFPAFLASSPDITPTELYQKVTCREASWNSPLITQDSNNWDQNQNCYFKGGEYIAVVQKPNGGTHHDGVQECFAEIPIVSNFAYQIQMTMLNKTPSGGGGLIFRAPNTQLQTMYRVDIDKNGSYNFYLAGNQKCHLQVVDKAGYFCTAPTFHTGVGQANTITVIGVGETIYLYVNGDYVDTASNNVSGYGYIGVFTNFYKNPSEVAFSKAKVWNLW
jgi:hypothetical protein